MEEKKEHSSLANKMAYRPAEVSQVLGLSLPLVYGMIRSGVIPSIIVNNSIIVPRQQLEEALSEMVGQEIRA